MSSPRKQEGLPEKRPLNLGKFAPTSSQDLPPGAPNDEGPTMKVRRIAAQIVEKKVAPAAQADKEFGLPLKEMLGVITHCYARGVFCSKDIAQVLRDEPALRKTIGRKLPTEDAIRTFRRRYAGEIEEALGGLFRAFPGGGPTPATPDTSEGTQQLRRVASQRLHEASWTDNTKGRIG
jgi:hypothetical protein